MSINALNNAIFLFNIFHKYKYIFWMNVKLKY